MNLKEFNLTELSVKEQEIVNGGGSFMDFVEAQVMFHGYVTGRYIDFLHGVYDGLVGEEKH